nr:hypothetical protein [Tanacetum cinerariifolium]
YLKDLEECMDNGDSRVAKEMKLFDALEHKSVVIEVDGQEAWDAELDLADSANYVTEKVLDSMGFVHVSISDYGRKMGNLLLCLEGTFWQPKKSQVDFGLGEIRMSLTMFEEVNGVIVLLEEFRSSSEEVVKMGKANRNKGKRRRWNAKYDLVGQSFLDIEDDIERALALKKSRKDTLPNPFIEEYEKRNKKNTITYSLQPMSNGNLKWKDFPSVERHTYCERLLKLQDRSIGVPRLATKACLMLMMMGALEESRGVNLAWIIADHLYKHASGTKESSVICAGHYVIKIASSLEYCMDDEIKKCLEPIDYEY